MENFAGFIQTYLNVETAFNCLPRARSALSSFAPERREPIKWEFSRVLETKELPAGRFCDLTFVDFESDGELCAYLRKVYDYLFLDSGEVPVPPD